MINRFWPKPLEAEGDMKTDDDATWPVEYCRNPIASVDEDKEDEQEEEVEEENNSEE